MKTALITFFVFVTLNSCNAQSNNNVSKASVPDSNNNKSTNGPLLVTIRSNNSIKVVTIKNRSNDTLWYYVSIELYDPGLKEWTNAVEDIDPKAGNWIIFHYK
ncbi:hypothetical protein A8C56_00080 [Niabella ginsenosidivorans]|uniref:Uncharacterized protein n=1 Tax=Niabella ginsenosidivorans TaxID=1176587 RepID=A0A1A9HYT0_9BACT|nr:hypothetical protein [Niabella ginsenosidivorans]ANH79582.1 hypothetical protein A8C56_00080 [Niabella ginsenosidivorans]